MAEDAEDGDEWRKRSRVADPSVEGYIAWRRERFHLLAWNTRSSATAERQRVSYTRADPKTYQELSWSCSKKVSK